MHETEPEVFLLAHTTIDRKGLDSYLASLGVEQEDWYPEFSTQSDPDLLTEIASRSCYMSYGTMINKNISRVREGNYAHIKNILESGHGSVLEHASATFAFRNVSRVFTHEVVRHRAGWAWSQESLRYVRADELGYWVPEIFKGNEFIESIFRSIASNAEHEYKQLLDSAALKEGVETFEELDMSIKKKYTSAARRILPIGMSTNIIGTANIRALRHVIEMRTNKAAEEEIRMVFQDVAVICTELWPNLFQDIQYNTEGEYWFENKKV
ncbi:hypothetical protein LCGC14_0347350 [marine sediment metagenome]|uniref:Thymidylate synthase (FAD) n=1 Tax=marine sediment metagenome TaxID=412755 RepID=A0A0F9WJM4_9ZZZZ